MIKIKIKIGNYNKTYNLNDPSERSLMINNILLYNTKRFPFFINTLITLADIEDVEESQKEELAYTYYCHEYERIKIHINFSKIEKYEFKAEEIIFLIFHEFLHNYFYHFSRLKKESEENNFLANIVMDYYVNETLYEMFRGKITRGNFVSKDIDPIDQISIEEFSRLYKREEFPYNFNNKPLEPVLYKWFKNNDNNKNSSSSSGNSSSENKSGKQQMDNHDVGRKKAQESIKKVNEERKKNGQPQISEYDIESIARNKIENIENEMKKNNMIGNGDKIILREKERIMKKNPFLNFLKLKSVINKQLQINTVKTYKRISRKRDNSEIIFKGKRKQEGKKVVVALDVSGSISDKDIKTFYEMIAGFIDKNKNQTNLDIIYWSSCQIKPEVNFHRNIKDVKELMKIKINSSGGTEIEYLHDFINKYYGEKKEKIVLINITDGYFYIQDKIPEEVLQYFFVLTEPNNEEEIIKKYNDKRIKTTVIKELK